jgi:dolichyl-phosphate-mannose-protein mannosyltransferase
LGGFLRFWQLSRFNDLVFDEVYFAKFAQAYLAGEPSFDAHPPLGKYLIAAGIWLSEHVPTLGNAASANINPQTGLSPLSYRWMNAFVGSCIPLIVFGICHSLYGWQKGAKYEAKRWMFALIAAAFVAIDGLFVTESRYALINTYVVFWGLLGHWLWLQADSQEALKNDLYRNFYRSFYYGLAGIALGASIATKWNGVGYLLALLLWEIWRIRSFPDRRKWPADLFRGLIYGVAMPLLIYGFVWWPHLRLSGDSIVYLHQTLFRFHQQVAPGGHSACSPWYSWPLLIKPIAYWYRDAGPQVYTVNNLGNPLLWWLSSGAIALLTLDKLLEAKAQFIHRIQKQARPASPKSNTQALSTYILIGYGANWLPWMLVSRCTFIYLYMPAAVFSFMLLAWLLSEWLHSPIAWVRTVGWAMLVAIALAFCFWLPLSLGSPLSPEGLSLRWWLRTWI